MNVVAFHQPSWFRLDINSVIVIVVELLSSSVFSFNWVSVVYTFKHVADIKILWNGAHLENFTHLTRREIVFFNWIKIKGFKWGTSDIKAVVNVQRWARTARLSLCNVFLPFPPTLKLILFGNYAAFSFEFFYRVFHLFHEIFHFTQIKFEAWWCNVS